MNLEIISHNVVTNIDGPLTELPIIIFCLLSVHKFNNFVLISKFGILFIYSISLS